MYDDLENDSEMDDISDDLREIMECQQRAKRAYDIACDNADAASRDYYDGPCPRTLRLWQSATRELATRHDTCLELAREFADVWESHHGYGEN